MYGRSSVRHDLRHAFRLIRNRPGFSAAAIVTIALAIGANAAMFTLVKGLFLSPLPYPEPDRIVRVLERLPTGEPNGISTLNYLDWSKQNTVFEYLAAEAGWNATLTGGGEPVLIQGAQVSARYFDIFGTKAEQGQAFLPDQDQPGRDHVVLLSHRLWERRFGSDAAILGRDISLDGEAYTVIGILPKGGPFDRAAAEIWKPLAFQPSSMTRDFRWLGASAKLKPGVVLNQAQAEMDAISQRLARAFPDSNARWGVVVDRLADVLVGPQLQIAVTVLFDAAALVLLIACANLASLALARSISREREMALRAALGASRWRLVRQVLIENVVVAACGGVAGAGVGIALLKWIRWLIPADALPPAVDIHIDSSVLLFTLILAAGAGLLLGSAPAVQTTMPNLAGAMKGAGHGTSPGRAGLRMRALVVVEIALAFILLVASGLLMRSFSRLLDVNPGFDAANVLTAGLPIHQERHRDPAELNNYLASIRHAVDAVPGVRETAITSALPLEGWGFGLPYAIAGRAPADRVNRRRAFFKIVSPSYFSVLRITRRSGRMLSDDDSAGGVPVVVINETLARREFSDEDPIGQRILAQQIVPGKVELGREIAWDIVGVIAGEKVTGLGDEISAGMYVSNQQSPTYGVSLVARSEVSPESLQKAVRSAVAGVDTDQALSDVRTLDQIVARSMLGNRVMSTLFTIFGFVALLLAVAGIYGVMSYTTAQRTREMGIRAALGASGGDLRRLVLQNGMALTLMGLAIGFGGAFVLTDVMSSMLYGIGAHDPLTIVVVAVVLSAVAGLACFVPARRLAKVDPMDVLRNQ